MRNYEFWKTLETSQFILDVIMYGYKLPFLSVPVPKRSVNSKSALNQCKFVWQAISELVESGRVREVPEPPTAINPLSVSIQASGKKRLILDLRYVNQHLSKTCFKYEDWKTALAYFERGS